MTHPIIRILACGALALVLAAPLCPQQPPASTTPAPEAAGISIVAMFRGDMRNTYLQGIREAVETHPLGSRVTLTEVPYGDEGTAFDLLEATLQDKAVDVVLGPTDSGVYLRAVREFDEHTGTVVIAPLVAATTDFTPGGHFFSTNADLLRRSQMLGDLLSKHWLRSVTVLHPETQFGQMAEAAFRESYQLLQPSTAYRSLQYESEGFKVRPQIDHILRDRPEALGIFGTRAEIGAICALLGDMNTTLTPYRPILFTPIDARDVETEDGELLLTSLVALPEMDDVRALTHDTTLMVLDQIEADQPFEKQRDAFRARLVDVLRGTRQLDSSDYRTPMEFVGGRNVSRLYVLRQENEELSPVTPPGFLERMILKVTILWRTVGIWPIFNLLVILLIPMIVSIIDLRRWYEGRMSALLLSYHAGLFVVFNIAIVVVLYVYLAETGRVQYESTLTALIIAMTPMTLVRSTFFNTPTGNAIGLAKVHDSFLKWLNERLMLKKYRRRQRFINIIAYYNTLESMLQELYHMYDNSRDESARSTLREKLDTDLEAAPSNLEQRFVCARRLMTRLNWRLLESMGYVPADPALQGRNPADPDLITKIATRYIRADETRRTILAAAVQKVRDQRSDAKMTEAEQGKVFSQVRLIVQYGFFTPTRLIEHGLLPADWKSFLQRGSEPPSIQPAVDPAHPPEKVAEGA